MWPWLVGLGAAVLFFATRGGAQMVSSRFVVVDATGVQHVINSMSAKFTSELSKYHLFLAGVGIEQLPDGVLRVRSKRDVGPLEAALPRMFSSVQQAAGNAAQTSTFMDISELDALLSEQKPQSITVFIAPRAVAAQRCQPGSRMTILD